MKKQPNKHIGTSLDDFLREEGVLEEVRAQVLKEMLEAKLQRGADSAS